MTLYSIAAICFLALVIIPQETFECATNGLCGYQPSCGAYAPPPPPPCGCSRGYGCGSYGCYRQRARGAKSFQPKRVRSRVQAKGLDSAEGKDSEQSRQILQERLAMEKVHNKEELTESEELELVSRTVARNNRKSGPVNPDRAFYECCMDRKLPDACLSKCNFASYNKNALQAMYFKQDACPLDAMKEMQFCAAQGRDHRDCCMRQGVTTTLAGPKCLSFCDQRLGHPQQLDMSYVPCFDRFESMKACFWHDLTRYYKA